MEPRPEWAEIVEAARDGDVAAQAELLARFEPLARSMAKRLVSSGHVDDVVQESCAAALKALPRLRTAEAFPAWLRLIIRKEAQRVRRFPPEVGIDAAPEPAMPDGDPAEHVERREVAALVRLALAAARDDDRRLLELRHVAGWTNDELAELFGVSVGAIRKRLHDARRRARPLVQHLYSKENTMADYRPYLDKIHDAKLEIPAAGPLRRPGSEATVTGLKVIDVMAPIRRGGTIEMVGPAGNGQVVVVFELLYRLGRTERDVACVGVGRAGSPIGSQPDLSHIVTEPGIPGPNAAILTGDAAEAGAAFAAGSRLAAGLAHQGLDVILVVDQPTLEQLDSAALAASAGLSDEGSVTVIALNTVAGDEVPLPSPRFDTTLLFSVENLALGIFPAIDGARSLSILDVCDAASAAKKQLTDAASLRTWFNQPMYVAQDFTGEDGTWIEPDTATADLAALAR